MSSTAGGLSFLPRVLAAPQRHVAYATRDKVVGLLKLPLDGNPNKGMGLVAHPGEVSAMAVSWDGAHLLTAGGAALAIHMWSVAPAALEPTIAAGGGGLAPHLSLLDGGAGGTHHQEMRDYFYYAQLRAQGQPPGPPTSAVLTRLNSFTPTRGLVFGNYGECSSDVVSLLEFCADRLAAASWRLLGSRSKEEAKGLHLGRLRQQLGLFATREFARCRLRRAPYVGCCLLYTSPSPRDATLSRMPSSA